MVDIRRKILALVPYPLDRAPSQRYRLEQWAPLLLEEGIQLDFLPFIQDLPSFERMMRPGGTLGKARAVALALLRRSGVFHQARKYDAVIIHREAAILGPPLIEILLSMGMPLVFDFDDAVWSPNYNPASPLSRWVKFPRKTYTTVKRASAIMAGNDYLGAWASRYNNNVTVIPTTIDTKGGYRKSKEHQAGSRPVVGWSGSPSTVRYLDFIKESLYRLHENRPYKMKVICGGAPFNWDGLQVEQQVELAVGRQQREVHVLGEPRQSVEDSQRRSAVEGGVLVELRPPEPE